jgi:hypothetical protein
MLRQGPYSYVNDNIISVMRTCLDLDFSTSVTFT